jgi:hypothetical protein
MNFGVFGVRHSVEGLSMLLNQEVESAARFDWKFQESFELFAGFDFWRADMIAEGARPNELAALAAVPCCH